MNFYIVNDSKNLNKERRSSLVNELVNSNFFVKSVSFDLPLHIMIDYFKREKSYLISSNLLANIMCIIFSRIPGVIIVNGLGRLRRNQLFRNFLIKIIKLSNRKVYIFQSYADFRYFRKHIPSIISYQINGSGGRNLILPEMSNGLSVTAVQRDGKVGLVSASILDFIQKFNKEVVIIGVNFTVYKSYFSDFKDRIFNIGYVDLSETISFSSGFLQPTGYGEGISQSLCDAIYNDIPVYIHYKEYIRSGLYRNKYQNKKKDSWVYIPNFYNKNDFYIDKITLEYMQIIKASVNSLN